MTPSLNRTYIESQRIGRVAGAVFRRHGYLVPRVLTARPMAVRLEVAR